MIHLYLHTPSEWALPPHFPINNLFKITFIPMHATFLTHFVTVLWFPTTWQAVQIIKLHIMYPSPPSSTVFSTNIIPIILSSNNQLINGKKHSPVLQALFYVIHSMHFLPIHILINKMDQSKSNKTNHKPHFILHTKYCFSTNMSSSKSLLKTKTVRAQRVFQVVATLTFFIRIKSPIMLKFWITNVHKNSPYCCNTTTTNTIL